jgi:hypothetical protein
MPADFRLTDTSVQKMTLDEVESMPQYREALREQPDSGFVLRWNTNLCRDKNV